MTYAPYHNGELTATRGRVCGFFAVNENPFEYALRTADDNMSFAQEFPHIVFVLDGKRYAKVVKTRAYVVVDEDEHGLPVIKTWVIKRHKIYA